jgi:hypothetical protein
VERTACAHARGQTPSSSSSWKGAGEFHGRKGESLLHTMSAIRMGRMKLAGSHRPHGITPEVTGKGLTRSRPSRARSRQSEDVHAPYPDPADVLRIVPRQASGRPEGRTRAWGISTNRGRLSLWSALVSACATPDRLASSRPGTERCRLPRPPAPAVRVRVPRLGPQPGPVAEPRPSPVCQLQLPNFHDGRHHPRRDAGMTVWLSAGWSFATVEDGP